MNPAAALRFLRTLFYVAFCLTESDIEIAIQLDGPPPKPPGRHRREEVYP